MMNNNSFLGRFGRDRTFWLVVGSLLVLYFVLEFNNVVPLVMSLCSLVLAITVHECAHAWSADELGDPTARDLGRISLNPIRHLDPMGSAMIIITAITGFGIGWGKPVPVNPHRLKHGSRVGGALVSLAGPAANLLLALIAGLLLRLIAPRLDSGSLVLLLFSAIVYTNIIIAFFNLIPIPPLDGHSVLVGLLSLIHHRWAFRFVQWIEGLRRYGFMLLFGLIIISQLLGLNILGSLIGRPAAFMYRLIMGGLT